MKYVVNQDKVAKYLSEKKLASKCALCGTGDMELLTDIVHGLYDFPFVQYGGGEYFVILLLPFACINCGNTHFINAYQQGLLDLLKEAGSEA